MGLCVAKCFDTVRSYLFGKAVPDFECYGRSVQTAERSLESLCEIIVELEHKLAQLQSQAHHCENWDLKIGYLNKAKSVEEELGRRRRAVPGFTRHLEDTRKRLERFSREHYGLLGRQLSRVVAVCTATVQYCGRLRAGRR